MEEAIESSGHVGEDEIAAVNADAADVSEPVDLEDGELSDEDNNNESSTQDATAIDENNESQSQTALTSSGTTLTEESEKVPAKQESSTENLTMRKSSESSDNNDNTSKTLATDAIPPKQDDSSDSSSSSDEDKSDRKRKRKLEKRRKKERKREKRKREKQKEREERKKRRKYHHDNYDRHDEGGYCDDYNSYYDGGVSMTSPRHHRQQRASYDREYYYNDRLSPPGPYDSPPPDESSEDEFSEALVNMVQSELTDPNVSIAEKEALIKKSQKRIPGLTQAKLNKIMKKNRWSESNSHPSRASRRGPPRRMRERDDEPKQKCKFYAEGKCQKGDKCQYSHNFIPAKKMEACKFFLQGYCAKGDMCIYLHSEVPCKYFHTRQQCFNADKCKFSHDPLTDSTRPLLEKAILLEETGTFKPEKPSLLGSPPKDIIASYANRFGSNVELDNQEDDMNPIFNDLPMDNAGTKDMSNKPIPSIFDLSLKPTADLREKLDAGLYEEITAPISDGEEDDQYGSPIKKPQSFYSDTLPSHNKAAKGQIFSPETSGNKSTGNSQRKNRWGPDLPTPQSEDTRLASGDAEPAKRGPLLPLPTLPTPFSSATQSNSQKSDAFSAPTTEANDLSKAAVNLNKIISALRSTSQGAAIVKTADPRLTTIADPRVKSSDPRSNDTSTSWQSTTDPRKHIADPRVAVDPRQTAKSALLPDPRNSDAMNYNDPRQKLSAPIKPSPPRHIEAPTFSLNRPAPELNGIPTRPMDYHVKPVTVESKGVYIPPGADSSQEMLKDPRIRKRIQDMKQGERHAPPSLPDITADLDRMRNAMGMSNSAPIGVTANKSQPTPNPIDPRRSSVEKSGILSSATKNNTNNPAKMTLSRIQQTLALHNSNSANRASVSNTSVEDEEEGNSLTIDVPDEPRNGTSNLAAPCS